MKKITLLLTTIMSFAAFAQSKTTGTLSLSNSIPITANFTLNNDTSQVILVLTGPSDRWFGLGIGVQSGFGMGGGDVVVFSTSTTPNLTDRNFQGTGNPPQDIQDWTTVSNSVSSGVRTLTLVRALTNTDPNDFQMPYATTNSINFGGVRAGSVTMNVGAHGGSASAGYVTNATFTTLGVEDFSLNAAQVFPNPSNGNFVISSKVNLQDIAVYSQTGALISTIKANDSTTNEINLSGLAKGVYLLELKNETDKSWKKIIIE
jgi:hypothetical protein